MRDAQFDALVAVARGVVPPASDPTETAHDGADTDGHDDTDTDGHDDTDTDGHDDTDDEEPEGIDFDGLRVDATDEGFRFETPEQTARGLSRGELRELADGSPYVTNWYFWEWELRRHGRPKRAFLRRAEAAHDHRPPARYEALREGLVTEWGQLRIEARLGDHGRRRYELRHVDEADVDRSSLTTYREPQAARAIAETDADGRYRPLKTAPSLSGGWVFPDLDWERLTETIETFYPATIANWHREQRGELDVDHWRDTAERQTGIYGIVDELDAEAVDRIAQSCCVDSQCTKRREWQYDGDTELAADGGTGVYPCREPCSLVVAAARKWTTLEREDERTYEFTLTPSEKAQLEEIVETVADGGVGEIREADVYEGANRYRARYLRAKRFVDGNLCGLPDEPDEHTHEDHGHEDDDHGSEHDDHGESHDDHDDDSGHEGNEEGHDDHDGDHGDHGDGQEESHDDHGDHDGHDDENDGDDTERDDDADD